MSPMASWGCSMAGHVVSPAGTGAALGPSGPYGLFLSVWLLFQLDFGRMNLSMSLGKATGTWPWARVDSHSQRLGSQARQALQKKTISDQIFSLSCL